MAKMRDMDVRTKAVEIAMAAVKDGSFMDKAEAAGQKTLAFPVNIDIEGNGTPTEVWVTAEFVCKAWKPYNSKGTIYPPYNPFEDEEEWQETLRQRENRAKEVADKKAKKIAKQNAAKVKEN